MESNISDKDLVSVFETIDREMASDPKVRKPEPLMIYANMKTYYFRKYRYLRDNGKL